jgi:Uma2 family endonuclease
VTADDYIDGPPELLVEVAASSAAYDLHDKRQIYARNGVQEYLALQIYEQRVDWFILREGVYTALAPDAAGILRSAIFPGLWFDPSAFWRDDLAALLAAVQRGIATPEHAAFVARLRNARLPDAEA